MTLTASLPEEYGIHSQGDLNCAVFHVDTGLFPLNQKFRFAFPETLIGEKKKKTFSGIRKRGQPRQLYPSVRKCLNGNFRPV